jgi:acetolactate synthase-1/2/3 large subunit
MIRSLYGSWISRHIKTVAASPPRTQGAKVLFDELCNHGVELVAGYPGGAALPIIDQFAEQNKIRFIQTRTEAGAMSLMEGYAKATGKPGVVVVTSGPGGNNCITGMKDAMSDGKPILVIGGQVASTVIGTDAFQETDLIATSKSVTKGNAQILDGTKISQIMKHAFKCVLEGRPGSYVVDCPKDVMSHPHVQDQEEFADMAIPENSSIEPEDIIKMIIESKRPLILAGQGVLQSNRKTTSIRMLHIIANRYEIPVTTTLMGLGCFDEFSYLSLHMLGMHGSYYANKAIQECDLLINFGSRFDDRITGDPKTFAPKAKIIHVDILSSNINKVIKTPYFINRDCGDVLKRMLWISNNNGLSYENTEWLGQINEWKKTVPFRYPKKSILQGRQVIAMFNKIIQEDQSNWYSILADVGAHQMWAAQFIRYRYPCVSWDTSGGQGQMGYALAAAMGAKLAFPGKIVICFVGDGGFSMTFTELITAVENNIEVLYVVLDNKYQLMVKMWQEMFYKKRIIGTKMYNPPFEKVAKAMGCNSVKIDINCSNEDLERKIRKVLKYMSKPNRKKVPYVLVCHTDENEKVLPMVSPGKSLDDMIINEDVNETFEGDAPC